MTSFIRSMVRPIATLTALAVVSWMVLQGREVPMQYGLMLEGMLAWWFWDRSKLNGHKP